ncbi:MAG TPA: AAA family ATPase [Alphaproteobacteria bacterium]|nr:AAA family ATPase [Alphaproteobacteria bacterium]
MTAPVTAPLPTLPVHAIEASPTQTPWLVEQLWGDAAVGVIGGVPKACKSWLGLELAVSVASGTACLGHFPVENPGPVVVYLAEDALSAVRDRIDQLCQHRGLTLAALDLHVVTAPSLRLDLEDDRRALDQTLAVLQPKMLLLDPLVRLHRLDENSAADISGLLGFLRELNRRHDVAIVLVHHMGKRARHDLGQALRGSSDVHAWTDSACYLVPRRQQLRLTVQHRAAAAPDPMLLRFVSENGQPCRLQLDGHEAEPPPLAEAVRAHLRDTGRPCSRTDLRQKLRVNNARLGEALSMLEQRALVVRRPSGWTLSDAPDDLQGILSE